MAEEKKDQFNPQETQNSLNEAVSRSEQSNPTIAEALRVMNISYKEYLAALSALQKASSSATNSTKITL